jgi:hypothetical protein
MNSKTKEHEIQKEDDGQFTNGNIVSRIAMFAAMPLIGIGLYGHAFLAITQGGWLLLLSLLAFTLGLGGLALSFSKVKYGLQIGALLITVATAISFWFTSVAVIPNETHSVAMIMIGDVIAILFALLDFMVKMVDTEDIPVDVSEE